ncbi:MAG TPA: prepilin peptidase [Methylibium sp.]|uniref:prepilin peptidase n=1 Tax=Methylibium sp. TaxID=2067992 RepID=UPI002DB6B2E7|nr:prepilin peptidase [Methylibium sp.]HEU4458368.1 prepilin peptidase [Methylibium sp.]
MSDALMPAGDLLAFWLSPWVLGLFGLAIGSFLNVVIHRLPQMMERGWWGEIAAQLKDGEAWRRLGAEPPPPAVLATAGEAVEQRLDALPPLGLARPRSACPVCGHKIAWHENLPLVGWLRLRGRCSACGAPISARYPVVELATGALFFALAMHFGPTPAALVWCVAGALLVAMTMIDIDTQYLPDDLTLPLLALGLFAAGLGWIPVSMSDAAWGALAGWFGLWAVNATFKLVRGVDGMGGGDFKLLAGLGALLGWKVLPAIVLLSSAVGAVVGIALIALRRHGWAKPLPFGPYLVGGGLAAVFFGDALTRLYFPG